VSPAQIAELEQRLLGGESTVAAVVPMVQTYAMLSYQSEQAGVMVQGIDSSWPNAQLVEEHMIAGHLEQLQPGEFGIVLGSQLARQLNTFVGDRLQLTLPEVSISPAGIFPRLKRFVVMGVFTVGAQVDASVAFIHQQDARKLLRLGDNYQGVQLQMHSAYDADQWLLTQDLPEWRWRSWSEQMGTLFQAMRMEKMVVSLLLSVIIAVAAFNIIASLVLMVADKRKDIAVVRAMGASSGLVVKIFVVQGMAVGMMGIIVGTALGSLLAYFIGDIVAFMEALTGVYLFDPSVYLISALPSRLLWSDVAIVTSCAGLISFLATLYPAWRAGQVLPAEALRYEQ
jgi:lipoprotein-releasing system permease protein